MWSIKYLTKCYKFLIGKVKKINVAIVWWNWIKVSFIKLLDVLDINSEYKIADAILLWSYHIKNIREVCNKFPCIFALRVLKYLKFIVFWIIKWKYFSSMVLLIGVYTCSELDFSTIYIVVFIIGFGFSLLNIFKSMFWSLDWHIHEGIPRNYTPFRIYSPEYIWKQVRPFYTKNEKAKLKRRLKKEDLLDSIRELRSTGVYVNPWYLRKTNNIMNYMIKKPSKFHLKRMKNKKYRR